MIRRLTDTALRLQAERRVKLAWFVARVLGALRPRDIDVLRLLARLATENDDLASAEEYCRKVLELAPDDAVPLEVLAQIYSRSGRTEEALPLFAHLDRLTYGPGIVTRAFRQEHLDLARAKALVPYYKRLENVLVDTDCWSIMTDTGVLYSRDTLGRNLAKSPFVRGRIWDEGRSVIASFPEPGAAIEAECIFVGNDGNYSHWLFRNLLKLVSLEEAGLLHKYPWLLARVRPYELEYLRMLGVDPESCVLVEPQQVIRCRQLIVPALLTDPRTLRTGISWIRGRVAPYMSPPAEARGRIYVTRADARRRFVLNDDELFAALEPYGFTKVAAGHMSVAEQIKTFSNARVIVGAHGASMTNIIFAPPDASIIELSNAPFSQIDDFRRAAQAAGQSMVTLVSDHYADGEDPDNIQANYYVDVPAVMKQLERAGVTATVTPGRDH